MNGTTQSSMHSSSAPPSELHNGSASDPLKSDTSPTIQTSATESEKQMQQSIAIDPTAFPDGGSRAWLTVLGCWCVMFISFGWIQSVGVFQAYYELDQLSSYTHSEVAWIVSLEAFCLFFGGLFVGPIGDKHGPRILLIGGTLLHAFGLFMASLSTRYYQFLLSQGLTSAIGTAMVFYPSISCVVSWFHKKRSTAIGIAASGSGFGGVFFPLIVRQMLVKGDAGFGWTMRTCAFLVLFLGAVACLTTTSRLPPTPKKNTKEEISASLKEKVFVLVWIVGPLTFLAVWVVSTFIVTTAIDRNVGEAWSFWLVPILNGASVFGRLIPGYLADITGPMTMYTYLSIFTFIACAGIWIPVSGRAGSIVFAVLFGFGSGDLNALAPAVIARISDVKQIGLRTGLVYALTGIGCLFGSPAGGAIISAGGYRSMQGFASAIFGVAAIIVLYIRYIVGVWDLRKRV